jgi:hypothetical protein
VISGAAQPLVNPQSPPLLAKKRQRNGGHFRVRAVRVQLQEVTRNGSMPLERVTPAQRRYKDGQRYFILFLKTNHEFQKQNMFQE